jgi:iron(III) transport system substrate-binding protein
MSMSRRSLPLLASTLTLGLLVAGCSAADDDDADPAPTTGGSAAAPAGDDGTPSSAAAATGESDGALTLYSGRDEELIAPLVEAFEDETGIDVDVRYGNTPELAALLLEEGDATPAEVFLSQDAGALGAVAGAGLFAPLPGDVAESVPAEFTSTDGSWVGVTGRARVVVHDGEEVSADDLPDTIDGYVEPEWRGRVGVAPTNASFQSFVTAYRVLEGDDAAASWVEALAANEPQVFEGNSAILEAVDAGVVDVGLVNHYYWYARAAEVGEDAMRAQVRFLAAGDPGAVVNVTGAGILAGAAGDADALAFVEYLVSQDGQTYFVEETYEYPLVEGIEAPPGLPPLADLVTPGLDLADLDDLDETQDLLARAGLV